jgi:hypothetical protein
MAEAHTGKKIATTGRWRRIVAAAIMAGPLRDLHRSGRDRREHVTLEEME